MGLLLLSGTAIALLMALTGVAPRAMLLVGTFWALYGLFNGFLGGVLEPVIDGSVHLFSNVGLNRAGGGYSGIETMVVRGEFVAAAEAYMVRAREPADRIEATLRRAALLAGPLQLAEMAAAELSTLQRTGRSLPAEDDVRVGLALADLYDYRLDNPGMAMAELRRLIDRYPESRHVRRIRTMLRQMKTTHFGSEFDTESATQPH